MKKVYKTIIYIVLCMLLTSCQTGYELEQLQRLHKKYDTTLEHSKSVNDFDVLDSGPVNGGTLKLFTTEPDTLNPVLTKNSYTADVMSFIYEGLTKLDESQNAVPVLADSWTVSDDGLVWNFHIRDGVKWHDGEAFTAYDAEFTIQTLLIPSVNSVYKPLLLNISSCMAVDSSNLKVALKKPNSFLPEMMSFPIIPKHKFISMDVLAASEQIDPVGTGPYRFDTYTPGDKILMSLNNDWWNLKENADLKTNGMYLESVQAKIVKNSDDAMELFQTGDVDVAGIPVNEYHKYKGRTDLTIKKYTSRDFEFIAFNLNEPVFSDIYARKAINMAINREKIMRELFPGEAVAAELPIMPDSWISDLEGVTAQTMLTIDTGAEVNDPKQPAAEIDKPAFKPIEKSTETDENSTELASARTPGDVLAIGGWKKNNQGYYKVIKGARRYLKVELLVNSNNSLRVSAAKMICAQLEEAGIPANLVQLGWEDLLKRVDTGKYNMAYMGCRVPQIPDISFMYSAGYLPEAYSVNTRNAYNVAGYSNTQVDGYIALLFSENDPDKKKAIYKALKEQIINDCPYVGLYFFRDTMIYSKDIKGQISPDTWNRFNDMTRWYKPGLN